MYNWSTDEKRLAKNSAKYRIWRLEQQLSFGLGGERLNEAEVRKNLVKFHLDPARKRFIQLLLDDKRNSH